VKNIPDMKTFLDYEIRSSWWACLIPFSFLQDLVVKYFFWKVKRKYNRYLYSIRIYDEMMKNMMDAYW
tara:strand:+ start:18088 stop:18291 length:204 start_codon:yes stop_codon:yes gene_type:complete